MSKMKLQMKKKQNRNKIKLLIHFHWKNYKRHYLFVKKKTKENKSSWLNIQTYSLISAVIGRLNAKFFTIKLKEILSKIFSPWMKNMNSSYQSLMSENLPKYLKIWELLLSWMRRIPQCKFFFFWNWICVGQLWVK